MNLGLEVEVTWEARRDSPRLRWTRGTVDVVFMLFFVVVVVVVVLLSGASRRDVDDGGGEFCLFFCAELSG